jgi:hypothetical protein
VPARSVGWSATPAGRPTAPPGYAPSTAPSARAPTTRPLGLVRRRRRDGPADPATVHAYRRAGPLTATLCGQVVRPGDPSWRPVASPGPGPALRLVTCRSCRRALARTGHPVA